MSRLGLTAVLACLPGLLWALPLKPQVEPLVLGVQEGFDYPLLKLFLCLAIGALLVVALLRRRQRPELLAVCFALSVVLHLLSLSLFSVMPVDESRPAVGPQPLSHRTHRIEIGIPSHRESLASRSVRTEPMRAQWVDGHAHLDTDRAAGSEPLAGVVSRAQATLPEPDARIAGRVELDAPAMVSPKQVMDELLETLPDNPIEVAPANIALQQSLRREPETKYEEPGASEKPFDMAPAPIDQSSLALQTTQPTAPQAGLKDAVPAQTWIDLAAAAPRQAEVKDGIQPVVARVGVERVAVPAQAVGDGRASGNDELPAQAGPSAELKLAKLAGGAPRTAGQRMPTVQIEGQAAKMSAGSLASAVPDGIERKQSEVAGLAADASANAVQLDPLRMSGAQALLAIPPVGEPEQVASADQSGRDDWMALKDQGSIDQSSLALQTTQPAAPQAGLKDAVPAQTRIDLAAAAPRQAEVKDGIQPVVARVGVERVAVPAQAVGDGRASGNDELPAQAGPSAELKLAKLAGGAPRTAGQRMPTVQIEGQAAKMSAGSLASAVPDGIERKQSEVAGLAADASANAVQLDPLRMSGAQALLAIPQAGEPGQVVLAAAPTARGQWQAARGQTAVPETALATGSEPRAGVAYAAVFNEPIRSGVADGAFAEPISTAPSVRDVVSDLPTDRIEVQSLGGAARKMDLVYDERGTGGGPAGGELGPSDLPALKRSGGLAGAQIAATRVISKPVAASHGSAVAPGTLIAGSGGMLQARDSASSEVREQLAGARAGGANLGGLGLTDMGSPAQTVPGTAGNGLPGGESEARPVALITGRSKFAGASVAAGGIDRPSPTGRTDLPVSQGSFVRQGSGSGSGVPPAQEAAAASGVEQIETGASLTLTAGDTMISAGRVSGVENQRSGGRRLAGGGDASSGRGQSELMPGKAGSASGSKVAVQRLQAPGRADANAAGRPAGTLVVASGLQGVGRPATAGTDRNESLAGMNTSASVADSSGPALTAPVVRRGSAGGGKAKAGIVPVGSLRVTKSGAGGTLLLASQSGSGLGELAAPVIGAGERGPARMDVSLSEGPPQAPVTSDISIAGSERAPRRSILSVGSAPKPGFVPDKAIYQMRKPQKRKQFIKELGGTEQTEQAVEQALDWLSSTQSADGRWDIDGFKGVKECGGAGDLVNEDVAVTGLSLLAYLGAGYTHLADAHQETVRKALDWLLNCEKEDGDIRGAGQMYGQAIATAALCESYSLTGDARLLDPARRAVQFIVDAQTPEAGWRYEPRDDSDTSVTGWQILALKSAQIAGIQVPEQTIKWTENWLDQVRHGAEGGLYSYKPRHAVTPVMTAEGAFCQLFMAENKRNRGQAESTAYIMQNLPAWDPKNRKVHLYYWYYATLALYLSGAQEFDAWNASLTKALLEGRRKSGPAAGSWDPVGHLGARGGRIYSTAAGALCLEVYYRFLPLYKQK